jgi:hypothetical protein
MHEKFRLHSDFHYECEEVCDYDDYSNDGSDCMEKRATYPGFIALWGAVVCTKEPHTKWHVRDCVFGECDHCGIKNLAFCPIEEEGTSSTAVSWKHFNMEKIVTKKGEERKFKLIYKSTHSSELMLVLEANVVVFCAS